MEPKPSTCLKVKVVPGSSRNEIVGWLGNALKIKVTAPPEKGQANEAVVELLAERLGLSTHALAVASGHLSPSKVIAIKGLDDEAIKTALGGPWCLDAKQNHPTVLLGTRPGGSWIKDKPALSSTLVRKASQ